jgi:hypothetical protein
MYSVELQHFEAIYVFSETMKKCEELACLACLAEAYDFHLQSRYEFLASSIASQV